MSGEAETGLIFMQFELAVSTLLRYRRMVCGQDQRHALANFPLLLNDSRVVQSTQKKEKFHRIFWTQLKVLLCEIQFLCCHTFGVVDLSPPVGVVNLSPPVGVVNVGPKAGVVDHWV